MANRLARAARLLIAILAVYGFVLQGFGRDAAALARMAPQAAALCLPGGDKAPDHDAGRACDLHCLGAMAIGGGTPVSPMATPLRFAVATAILPVIDRREPRQPLRLAEARGPPRLI
jgi:hypothetical protein